MGNYDSKQNNRPKPSAPYPTNESSLKNKSYPTQQPLPCQSSPNNFLNYPPPYPSSNQAYLPPNPPSYSEAIAQTSVSSFTSSIPPNQNNAYLTQRFVVNPVNGAVIVENAFAPGARFNQISKPRIPPPPPGVPPNAAQLAVLAGYNVKVTQKKSNFFSGGSGAGVTFW